MMKPQDVEKSLLNDRFALIAIKDITIGDELTMDYNQFIENPLLPAPRKCYKRGDLKMWFI